MRVKYGRIIMIKRKSFMNKITVKNIDISITGISDDDFVCLTDLAKIKNEEMPNDVIRHWLRRVDALNYLHLWEKMNNSNFKPADFDGFNLIEFDQIKGVNIDPVRSNNASI